MLLPSHFLEATPKTMANKVRKRDQRSQQWAGGRDFPKEMGPG